MCTGVEIAAVATAVASAAGTAYSIYSGEQAKKERKKLLTGTTTTNIPGEADTKAAKKETLRRALARKGSLSTKATGALGLAADAPIAKKLLLGA